MPHVTPLARVLAELAAELPGSTLTDSAKHQSLTVGKKVFASSYSPLLAGLAYLPLCAAFFVGFGAGSQLVPRLGARPVAAGGLIVAAAGLALLSGVSADGSYPGDLLVVPLGAGAAIVALTILALEGTAGEGAGLASAMLNTAQQVGNALGLAVLVSLAVDRTNGLLAAGADSPVAISGGFSLSFGAAAGVLVAGALLILSAARNRVAAQVEDARPINGPR